MDDIGSQDHAIALRKKLDRTGCKNLIDTSCTGRTIWSGRRRQLDIDLT